ncbi:hypothetical protein Scep_028558 [Stephania cephalantha]|uniref:Uncharacterized protein n=1 Tax=Stephania cephalantha TaxID=152367 RepID=A0AAP0HM69_9MAGN
MPFLESPLTTAPPPPRLFCSRSDFDFDFASPRLCHFSKPLLLRFLSLYMHLSQFDFALLVSLASTSVAQFEDSFTVHAQASDGALEGPSIVGDLLDFLNE